MKFKELMNEIILNEESNKLLVGDKFKNKWNEVHKIIKISKTGSVLTCKDVNTNKIIKFRFYDASGLYIKTDNSVKDLGEKIK